MKRIKIVTDTGDHWCRTDQIDDIIKTHSDIHYVVISGARHTLTRESAEEFGKRLEKHEEAQQLKFSACIGTIKTTKRKPAKKKASKKKVTKKKAAEKAKDLCFVLMPFKEPFDSYYTAIIEPAITKAGLRAQKGDSLFLPTPIMGDIWSLIQEAKVIVAILT